MASTGVYTSFKGMTTARFPLLVPVRNSCASYGASAVARTPGRGHVAEVMNHFIEVIVSTCAVSSKHKDAEHRPQRGLDDPVRLFVCVSAASFPCARPLHSPPPPRAQLCKRSCSNKHTHTHTLHSRGEIVTRPYTGWPLRAQGRAADQRAPPQNTSAHWGIAPH